MWIADGARGYPSAATAHLTLVIRGETGHALQACRSFACSFRCSSSRAPRLDTVRLHPPLNGPRGTPARRRRRPTLPRQPRRPRPWWRPLSRSAAARTPIASPWTTAAIAAAASHSRRARRDPRAMDRACDASPLPAAVSARSAARGAARSSARTRCESTQSGHICHTVTNQNPPSISAGELDDSRTPHFIEWSRRGR